MNIKVKIINHSPHPLPAYQTRHASGLDLAAFLKEDIVLKPFERALIPTGIYIELPPAYEAQIRPRSGLAYKHGISVLNTPGTIDADYRGEVKILLINFSNENFTVTNGLRIAQMIVSQHAVVEWLETDKLGDTDRGDGGYGHTGG